MTVFILCLLLFGLGILCGAVPGVGVPVTAGLLAAAGGVLYLIRAVYDSSIRG